MKRAWAEIDLGALRHNLNTLRQLTAADIFAVVKADAYGHGLSRCVGALSGTDGFAVATLDEASEVRAAGWRGRLLMLQGINNRTQVTALKALNVELVVHQPQQLDWLQALPDLPPLWLKHDSGMHRLGFDADAVTELFGRCGHQVTLMTHFANAEDATHPLNAEQIARFEALRATLPKCPVSLCNSAALLQFPAQHGDVVRPGLALYGVSPLAERSAADLGLQPVMTLKSRIISIKRVPAGDSIGYGSRYKLDRPRRIATVSAGYGDGYPHGAEDGTPVLINGTLGSIAGVVSMDMLTVDVSDIPATIGDEVTLWGRGLPVETVVMHAHTIPYTLTTGVTARVATQELNS